MSTKLVFHLQYVPKICTLKMISVDSITNTPGQSVQSSLLLKLGPHRLIMIKRSEKRCKKVIQALAKSSSKWILKYPRGNWGMLVIFRSEQSNIVCLYERNGWQIWSRCGKIFSVAKKYHDSASALHIRPQPWRNHWFSRNDGCVVNSHWLTRPSSILVRCSQVNSCIRWRYLCVFWN